MATVTLPPKKENHETMPEKVSQARPKEERYRLQVDRQTKQSFTTSEAAEKAGKAIKKAFPNVKVSVYDNKEAKSTVIE